MPNKTKTKKTARGSKTVVVKDGKRTVTKYNKDGSVRKVKGGGKVTKTNKQGKTTSTTRKEQVKRGVSGAKGIAKSAATIGAVTAAAASPFGIPMLKTAAGVLGGTFANSIARDVKGQVKKIKPALKARKKTVTKKDGVKTKTVTNSYTGKNKTVTKKVGSLRKKKNK